MMKPRFKTLLIQAMQSLVEEIDEANPEAADEIERLSAGVKFLENVITGHGETIAQLRADAERYRWMREQHWEKDTLCVVIGPRDNVKLGADCPSTDRLDAAIDAQIAGVKT